MSVITEWVTVKVEDGTEMRLYVARPEGRNDAPAMMVIQEAFGVTDHIRDITERLASEGYVAAAPEMFHRTAPPGFVGSDTDFDAVRKHLAVLTPELIRADLSATFEWLANDEHVDRKRIGSIGFCLGGRSTFIANSFLPLRAAVSYYGGGIATGMIDLVERQAAPILFFWGGQDRNITAEHRHSIEDAMVAAGKDFGNVVFSKADHAFMRPAGHSYHPEAATEAWALTRAFLADRM